MLILRSFLQLQRFFCVEGGDLGFFFVVFCCYFGFVVVAACFIVGS